MGERHASLALALTDATKADGRGRIRGRGRGDEGGRLWRNAKGEVIFTEFKLETVETLVPHQRQLHGTVVPSVVHTDAAHEHTHARALHSSGTVQLSVNGAELAT